MSAISDTEMRVKIAEACGWTWVKNGWGETVLASPQSVAAGIDLHGGPPDYLNSLEAMHKAEATLSDDQHRIFRSLLFADAYNSGQCNDSDAAERARVSATARQRAEAFIRVLP